MDSCGSLAGSRKLERISLADTLDLIFGGKIGHSSTGFCAKILSIPKAPSLHGPAKGACTVAPSPQEEY